MPTRLFEPGRDDVLYVIDLSGYVFRAYHAITALKSASGESTQAVLGTVNMLERLFGQCRPQLLAVAMESRARNFRKELYPAYKATRPTAPPDLKQQMGRVEQIITAWRVLTLQEESYEADDVIATLVRLARNAGLKTVIVSADKDLLQLVDESVLLWDTMRDRVVGPQEVKERFGVSVAQMRDFLALTGDPSDNIPGVPGVGPKTARELLTQYGTLDGIFERLAEVRAPKLRQSLQENEAAARLSQRLVTLKDDLGFEFDLASLRVRERNQIELARLYEELGFERQLLKLRELLAAKEARGAADVPGGNAGASAPSSVVSEKRPEVSVEIILLERDLSQLIARARQTGRLALSIESMAGAVIGLALSSDTASAAYVPFAHRYLGAPTQLSFESAQSELGPLLSDPNVTKVVHDKKLALTTLAAHGLTLEGVDFDTLIAGYLLDPEARNDLPSLLQMELNLDWASAERELGLTTGSRKVPALGFDQIEIERAARVAGRRAAAILELGGVLQRRLEEEGLADVNRTFELPLSRLLAELERTGVLVDVGLLRELGAKLDAQIGELERQAHRIVGKDFNVNSPRQLEIILFDELGLRPLKRTKTSRSTDAETLESLAEQHELARTILELRQLSKLKGTYVEALPRLVSPKTGRIHTRWGQTNTATGRLSSSDPNLQNIPIRTELGRSIRRAFVVPDGHLLLSADYSQIELRVLAHLSQDPVLRESFINHEDVHTRTAAEIFEVSPERVTSELRQRAKAVNFGVIYGQGDSGLAKSLGIGRAEAGSFIAAYFRRYQGVRAFMEDTLAKARASDSVRTLFGRRRLVPDVNSTNRAKRLAAERIAMNTPIQGTAADLLKLAMLALIEPPSPGARMILTVHDELVFEVPEAEIELARHKVKDKMENVYRLSVPLVVDLGHGKSWSDAH